MRPVNFYIICVLAFFVPLIILPGILVNAYSMPKTALIMIGSSALLIISVHKLNAMPNIVKILICFNVLSLFYTLNPYYTKIAIVLNISCLLVYFYTSQIYEIKDQTFLLWVISAAGLLVSTGTILQFFNLWNGGGLITATIGNPNYLGVYLIFPLFASLGLLFICKWKVIPIMFIVFILIAIVVARARSSWLGLTIGMVPFLIMMSKTTKSWWLQPPKLLIGALSLMLVGAMIWVYAPGSVTKDRVAFSKVFDATALQYRFKGYIPPAIDLWKRSPLFGTGLWSYRNQVYEAQTRINNSTGTFFDNYPNPMPRRAHNEYIEALVDGGVVYFILCGVLIGGVLVRGVRSYRRKGARSDRRIILSASIASLVSILVIALFFFPFRLNTTLFMICLTMGMVQAKRGRAVQ